MRRLYACGGQGATICFRTVRGEGSTRLSGGLLLPRRRAII